jgi:tRNA1Val (adenine37-N6)-methyltransferase
MNGNMQRFIPSRPDETVDSIYNGQLRLRQPTSSYRFCVDAPLLTAFAARGKRARLACDLGSGCGVVGLGLAWCGAAQRVVAVEIQPDLAEFASRNAAENGLEGRVKIVVDDVRSFRGGEQRGQFDLVVMNPPYFSASEGHLPEHEGRRIAGFEVKGSLSDFLQCGLALLNKKGRMCLVYPCRRLDLLLSTAVGLGFALTRLRLVHPIEGRLAELALAELRAGRPGRGEVEPPLILRTTDGRDTPEAEAIVSGRFS